MSEKDKSRFVKQPNKPLAYGLQVGDIIKISLSAILSSAILNRHIRLSYVCKNFIPIEYQFVYKRKLFKKLHFPKWYIFGEWCVLWKYVGSRKEG